MSADTTAPPEAAMAWADVRDYMASFGVTYRRFDHWVNRGFLGAGLEFPGTGYRRPLDPMTLRRAAAMGALAQMGVTPGWFSSAVAAQLAEQGSVHISLPRITASITFHE
jgi:hypothetical protein